MKNTMHSNLIATIVVSILQSFVGVGAAAVEDPSALASGSVDHFGWYTGSIISSPIGKMIYVRRKGQACLVRFTSYKKESEERPPTFFSSGAPSVRAEYDSYYQGDGSYDFLRANVKTHRGVVSDAASRGLGRGLSLRVGVDPAVKCGPLSIVWYFPHSLGFDLLNDSNSYVVDYTVEMAFTAVDSLSRVDFNDPKLKWLKVGERGVKKLMIPEGELPN